MWKQSIVAKRSTILLPPRLHLRPLLNDVPFIGGVTVSFLHPPELDFDLGGVASALELPGMDIVLRRAIAEHLQQTIVSPNSVSASLVTLAEGKRLSDLGGSFHFTRTLISIALIKLLNRDSQHGTSTCRCSLR